MSILKKAYIFELKNGVIDLIYKGKYRRSPSSTALG
jgi:hypothetical protein